MRYNNNDKFNLIRFLDAQDPVYDKVREELKNEKKQSHWMWFIFPQISGLGKSSTSKYYSIKSAEEAEAYLAHPVLGERLDECCEILLNTEKSSANAIFGSPDDVKLQSSMTLFAEISPENELFEKVLQKFFGGEKDDFTPERLQSKI